MHRMGGIVAVAVMSLSFGAFAGDWYVDQANGNNDNDGKTPETAKKALSTVWKTLAKPGDTVWIIDEVKISETIYINTNPGIVIAGYGEGATISLKDNCYCPLLSLSVDSVVSNLTLKGGVNSTADVNSWAYPAAGAEVSAGRLTHCTVTGCAPGDSAHHCAAVRITGTGVVDSCDIHDNDAGKLNTSYAAGVDVKSEDAKLLRSRIYRCRGRSAAVYAERGLVEDCEIFANTNYPAAELTGSVAAGSSAGIRADGNNGSCKIARCRIYDNYGYANGGGVWARDGAIIENCLIYGNRAETGGGGIYCNSGNSVIRFCNFGGNVSADGKGAAVYVNGGNPVFKDNIIYGNGSDPAKQLKLESTSAPFTYNLFPVAVSGEGNVVATKSPYVDEAAGDYMTASDSEGIDRAQEVADVGVDILGTTRRRDGGTGRGYVSDIGCVEYAESGSLSSPVVYLNPNGTEELPYDTPEKGARKLSTAILAVDVGTLGRGEVRVCPGDYEVASDEVSLVQPISVVGWDPERGAPAPVRVTVPNTSLLLNHADARVTGIDFDGRGSDSPYCVKVTQGCVSNCLVRGYRYELSQYEATNSTAFVGGALVLSGSDAAPKVCRAVDSTISNCVVTIAAGSELKNYAFSYVGAGVAFRSAKGATLERCVVCDCEAAGNGGGIYVATDWGRIVDCEVMRCKASIEDGVLDDKYVTQGGGIYMRGGWNITNFVSGCNIHHNYANGSGGGVFVNDGSGGTKLIWNCRITDNVAYAYAGSGVRVEQKGGNVILANCLVAQNAKGKNSGTAPGVYLKGGQLVNCTLAGNHGGASAAGLVVAAREISTDKQGVTSTNYTSRVRNTIVWGNQPELWDGSSAKELSAGADSEYSNVVVPAADAAGIPAETSANIITGDPRLSADYTLRFGSSAVDSGDGSFFDVGRFGETDLAGNARFFKNRTIDIGCFEQSGIAGLRFFVR